MENARSFQMVMLFRTFDSTDTKEKHYENDIAACDILRGILSTLIAQEFDTSNYSSLPGSPDSDR
jgi:hypothetical protein